MGFDSYSSAHILCVYNSDEGKSSENVVLASLSGILAHTGRCVAILSDNSEEFKNKVLNEVHDQLGIKRLFANPFHPQGNTKVENVHNFLK